MKIFNTSYSRQSRRSRTGFVKEDFNVFVRIFKQGEQERDFRDGIVSTSGVTTDPTGGGGSGEENDCISQKLDVEQQVLPLLIGQFRVGWVERDPRWELIRPQSNTQIFGMARTF